MPPTLSAYALVSLADFKVYLGSAGTGQDPNYTSALNAATAIIEREVDRELVTRGDVTEFHSLGWNPDLWYSSGRAEIYTGQWPIIAITTIHESISQPPVYDAGTLLTASDYEVLKPRGVIRRLAGYGSGLWASGNRAVQIVYSAGFRKTDGTPSGAVAVPDDLQQACMFVAASIAKESDRKQWGVSSQSDALGNVTHFMGYLPPSMREMLSHYRRLGFGGTWERAS